MSHRQLLALISLVLMLPLFTVLVMWLVHMLVEDIKKKDVLGVIIPLAFAGALLLALTGGN